MLGLVRKADSPTCVKAFPVEKPRVITRSDQRVRPGNRNVSRKRKKDGNLATWSFRRLFTAGALRIQTQELKRYKIMIAAEQETRLQNFKIFDTCNYGVYYHCNNEGKLLLTGFTVHNWVKIPMLKFEPKDEHICYIRLKLKFLYHYYFCACSN